jgi:hypothetical protein
MNQIYTRLFRYLITFIDYAVPRMVSDTVAVRTDSDGEYYAYCNITDADPRHPPKCMATMKGLTFVGLIFSSKLEDIREYQGVGK